MIGVLKSVSNSHRKSNIKLTGVYLLTNTYDWLVQSEQNCENREAPVSINEISIKCHLDWRPKSDVASNGRLMVLYPSAWSTSKHAWQGNHSIEEHHQDFSILFHFTLIIFSFFSVVLRFSHKSFRPQLVSLIFPQLPLFSCFNCNLNTCLRKGGGLWEISLERGVFDSWRHA